MEKRSKGKKNSIRINRNFFIFQGVVISLLLYLTWGSWVKFAIFASLEIIAYFSICYFLMNNPSRKLKKKSKHLKQTHKDVKNSRRYVESGELDGLIKMEAKNFNWEISDGSRKQKSTTSSNNQHDKNTKNSNSFNSGHSFANDSNKSGLAGDRKFVPYRSPFEPIRPKEEQKAETEKEKKIELSEANMPDSEHAKAELVETKEIPEDKAIGRATENTINKSMEEAVEETMEETVDETMKKNIGESLEEGIEKIMQDSHMNCNKPMETLKEELENEDNLDICNVEDEDTDFAKEELNRPIKPLPGLANQEKRIESPDQIHNGDSKKKFEEKKLLDMTKYEPPVDLLRKNEILDYNEETEAYIEYTSSKLIDTLASFGVGAKVINVSKGPTVTRYELQPNPGVKVSKIINLADDIALNLAATGVRIEAPIPGKAAVGIEIPNKKNVPVLLRDVIESPTFKTYPSKLAFAVGKDIAGNVVVADISKMPHLLIAGATGSGKSVCINTLIVSILYKASPKEVRLLMVDPKVVELGIYNGIPHLLIPVVTDPKKASGALTWAVIEMTNRYRLFAENNVRDLSGYNAVIRRKGEGEPLPHIVIIIDELADLMMVAPNEVEDSICRLAQMARAAGMHLVIATQRPSVNVITGVIKANIPSRISFAVSSQIDSRTILDMAGAEKLLGRGDMLFYPLGRPKPLRVQGSFISDKEVDDIVTHIKSLQSAEYDEEILHKIDSQTAEPQKPDADEDDELLSQAIEMVLELGQASASLIQRKLRVGYSRAARILDQMESWGVVSAPDGSSKPRQILITKQEWEELNT